MAAGPTLSFRASSHEYLEKFNTSAALTSGNAQDASPAQNSVQSYGFLRRIRIRLRNNVAGSGGTFNADYPAKLLQQISLTDPNGAEIYGGPTWSGYEALMAEKYGAYKAVNDPEISPLFSASTTTPLYVWTIPLRTSTPSRPTSSSSRSTRTRTFGRRRRPRRSPSTCSTTSSNAGRCRTR